MQETIILFNRKNTSNAASGINKVISKYLSEELPLDVTQYLVALSAITLERTLPEGAYHNEDQSL